MLRQCSIIFLCLALAELIVLSLIHISTDYPFFLPLFAKTFTEAHQPDNNIYNIMLLLVWFQ